MTARRRRSEEEAPRRRSKASAAARPRGRSVAERAPRRSSARARRARCWTCTPPWWTRPTTARCITLAFGINKVFKDRLKRQHSDSHIAFFLLEKKDKPNPKRQDAVRRAQRARTTSTRPGARSCDDPLYQWTRETNARALKLNQHVSYIHSKFLLKDPLGDDPIVVTGSANFSDASTNDNDENMLRDPRRPARRRHLLHRVQPPVLPLLFPLGAGSGPGQASRGGEAAADQKPLFLAETDTWLANTSPAA